jgi:hypothetical protein
MRTALVVGLVALAPLALADPPPRALAPEEVPARLADAVARGDAAMEQFRGRLFARLNELIVEGGPANAIRVCRVEAPILARELGATHRVELGRTSLKLRNQGNAPRAWMAAHLEATRGQQLGDVKPAVFDLGDRVGLLRPITVMQACTRCHGTAEVFEPEVTAELARFYPGDQATGFARGDLRGFIWAEVPLR